MSLKTLTFIFGLFVVIACPLTAEEGHNPTPCDEAPVCTTPVSSSSYASGPDVICVNEQGTWQATATVIPGKATQCSIPSDVGGTIENWTWSIADPQNFGASNSGQTVNYTPTQCGTYTITWTATLNADEPCEDTTVTVTKTFNVPTPPTDTTITPSLTICPGKSSTATWVINNTSDECSYSYYYYAYELDGEPTVVLGGQKEGNVTIPAGSSQSGVISASVPADSAVGTEHLRWYIHGDCNALKDIAWQVVVPDSTATAVLSSTELCPDKSATLNFSISSSACDQLITQITATVEQGDSPDGTGQTSVVVGNVTPTEGTTTVHGTVAVSCPLTSLPGIAHVTLRAVPEHGPPVEVVATITVKATEWVCDKPPTITVTKGSPGDGDSLTSCNPFERSFTVNVEQKEGLESLRCSGAKLFDQPVGIGNLTYAWTVNGQNAGNAQGLTWSFVKPDTYSVTCKVSGTADGLKCDQAVSGNVSWVVKLLELEKRCGDQPKLEPKRVTPDAEALVACFSAGYIFSVSPNVTNGTYSIWCGNDKVAGPLPVAPTGITYTWSVDGMKQDGAGASILAGFNTIGNHSVTCTVEATFDKALGCGDKLTKSVDWNVVIKGWTCHLQPKAVDTGIEKLKAGETPDPICLLRLGRTLTFDIPIRYEPGLEICDRDGQINTDGHFDRERPVWLARDHKEVAASGDGVVVTKDPKSGETYVRFDKKGKFTVTVTVTHRLNPKENDYLCKAPEPTKRKFEVRVVPPDIDIDSDNNNGPAAETPDASGSEDQEPKSKAPPAFAPPEGNDKEEDLEEKAPGKFAFINNGDWDSDGVSDWADGFDTFQSIDGGVLTNQKEANSCAAFIPVILRIPNVGSKDANTKTSFQIQTDNLGWRRDAKDSPWWYGWYYGWYGWFQDPTGIGQPVRLWLKDGGAARNMADPTAGGDLLRPGATYTPKDVKAVDKDLYFEITVYAELIAIGKNRISFNAWTKDDSNYDRVLASGITSLIQPTQITSCATTGSFRPFLHWGLEWDDSRQAERDAFFTWTIDGSGLGKAAYLLKPDAGNKPFRSLNGDKANQRYNLTGTERDLRILGGLIPDADPLDCDRSITRSYVVEIPGLKSAVAEYKIPVSVEVSQPSITITPQQHAASPERVGEPTTGGDPSLHGVKAIVRLPASVDLLDRKFFTLSDVGKSLDLRSASFSTDAGAAITDAPVRPVTYGPGRSEFTVMGTRPGATVFRLQAVIDGQVSGGDGSPVLDIPIVDAPVAIGEMPDPQDLATMLANLAKRRAGNDQGQEETPSTAPTLPGSDLTGGLCRLPNGTTTLPTDAAKTLYTWYLASLQAAGQLLPQLQSSNWAPAFQGDSAAPFGQPGNDSGSFTQVELMAAVVGRRATTEGVRRLLEKLAPPIGAWSRERNVEKTFSGQVSLDAIQRRNDLEVRAKHTLEYAALQRLKLEFTLIRDGASVPRGVPAPLVNQVLGGTGEITQEGFWEGILHWDSPVERLFALLQGIDGQNAIPYNIGNPFTEDIIQWMIQERIDLARGLERQIRIVAPGGPASTDWPFVYRVQTVGQRALHGISLDADTFEFAATQRTRDEMVPIPLIFAFGDRTNPLDGFNTVVVRNGAIDGDFAAELQAISASNVASERYGRWLLLTLRETYLLQQMQGTSRTAAWWSRFKNETPISFTAFVIGDFFLGLRDIHQTLLARDMITGEPLTPAQYSMSAGMTVLNLIPGSGSISRIGGKMIAAAVKTSVGKATLKGALANVGEGKVKQALQRLAEEEAKRTAAVAGEAAARRATGTVEQVVNNAAFTRATELVDQALLAVRHQVTPLVRTVMVGKTVRHAPTPGGGLVQARRASTFRAPTVAMAKQADETAAACARRVDIEDVFGQKLAKEDPDLYRHYIENTCFPAGTLVVLADGRRIDIADVHVGDRVRTRAEEDPDAPLTARLVTRVFERNATDLVVVTLDTPDGTQVIRSTPEHPYQVLGTGWVAAAELALGDQVRLANGSATVVSAGLVHQSVIVHNLEVADTHTYLVTTSAYADPVWVHNRCVLVARWDKTNATGAPGVAHSACPVFDAWHSEMQTVEGYTALTGKEQYQLFNTYARGTRWSLASLQTSLRVYARAAGKITFDGGIDRLKAELKQRLIVAPKGVVLEAHHLIPEDVVKRAESIFKNRTVTIGGVSKQVPGIGIDVHNWTNGVLLPQQESLARVMGFTMVHHRGYHKAYSDAIVRILDDIEKRMGDSIKAAARSGSYEDVVSVVAQYRDEVGLLQVNLRRKLVALPLYVKGSKFADTDALMQKWITGLGYDL
jgi:Pretoxin HINT domain/A nuclease family of the HNH/ENDO VII superfamily with conserved AHH